MPDQANPYPALAALDVFVLPSRVDAFPLVVLEAMILGVPVVAFDVGGVAEQVGGAGILVPAGDRDGLEAAVRKLVDDPALRKRLGLAGQARVTELYGIEDFDRRVVELIDRTGKRKR